MPTPAILIGTSGWSYDHWTGPFYPPDLPAGAHLGHYAQRLRSVKINHSFYRLPCADTLRHWRDSVPPDFVFTVKASRYITHMKKLAGPRDSISRFLGQIAVLGDRLGPLLFQLPSRRHCDAARLAAFLDALPDDYRYAFEFRVHS